MDRNDTAAHIDAAPHKSLSARRAWIEIVLLFRCGVRLIVALRKESVDRNLLCVRCTFPATVALRKESVDRNFNLHPSPPPFRVALRKESVDRNISRSSCANGCYRSLSARRAWIEMPMVRAVTAALAVALRKESVDRNVDDVGDRGVAVGRSPQGERG